MRIATLLLLGLSMETASTVLGQSLGQSLGQPLGQPLSQSAAGEAPALPKPIAWRQNVFGIPFRVNREKNAPDAPVEVRLYVSGDQGSSWRLYQKIEPGVGSFLFRAEQDGEYWFSLRTVDRNNREIPFGPHQAGMRVLIDTKPPVLELTAQRGDAGEVRIRWRSVDEHLQAKSLKIHYQTSLYDPLRLLAIGNPPQGMPQSTRSGEASWWPHGGDGEVILRAEVYDEAGNLTVSQTQLSLTAPPQANRGGSVAIETPPNAGSFAGVAPPLQTEIRPNGSQGWMPDEVSENALGSQPTPTQNVAVAPTADPFVDRSPSFSPISHWPMNSESLEENGPEQKIPMDHSNEASRSVVNSRAFELRYELTALGKDDIVELWVSRDNGQSWSRMSVDFDRTSPILVRVAEDGAYGCRIVVQPSHGEQRFAPRSGDRPDTIVQVDTTRPELELLGAEAGIDQLTIRWLARDENLADRPVSISRAVHPSGPWQTIAQNIENHGSYIWRPGREEPEQVYLQIRAQDQAGNASSVQSRGPVRLRSTAGSARISGVQPVGNSAHSKIPSRY